MQKLFSAALPLGLQMKHGVEQTHSAASPVTMGLSTRAQWQTIAYYQSYPYWTVTWQHFFSWQAELCIFRVLLLYFKSFHSVDFSDRKVPSLGHNSPQACNWKWKESLSWLPQVAWQKYHTQKMLNLEFKHICLLLGQFSNFFSYCLYKGSCRNVGERSIRRVVFRQALLGSCGGGQRSLFQAGMHAGLLAVLPRKPRRRIMLVAGPWISLDVPR